MRSLYIVILALVNLSFGVSTEKVSTNNKAKEEDGSAPLLTPDYGILKDIDRNKDQRSGIPFLPAPSQNYFYWQCLNLQGVDIDCTGVMRASSGMGCRRDQCIPEVQVFSEGATYSFMTHQVWCVEDYRDFKVAIKRLLNHEKVACFGSEYSDEAKPKKDEGKRSSFWFLKRIKTRHGSWDYFSE